MLDYELVAEGTDVDVANNYYVYFRRDADNTYFDSDDNTFKAFGSLVDGQLELTEDANQAGLWQISIPVPVTETGAYAVIPRDGQTDFIVATGFTRVYLVNGVSALSLVQTQVHLHDQFGGLDEYQVIDTVGNPVEGATIRIFTKVDYDAGTLDNPIGVTFTDLNGYWLDPIPVNPGDTFTIAVHKEGQIGPTSVEVIVP